MPSTNIVYKHDINSLIRDLHHHVVVFTAEPVELEESCQWKTI